jgi:hypothetical protein
MKEVLIKLIIGAYACAGAVAIIAYLPTVRDLFNKKPSANSVTFLLWTLSTGVSLLYSLFVLDDLLFRIVSGINFCSCAIILVLSLRLRKTVPGKKVSPVREEIS